MLMAVGLDSGVVVEYCSSDIDCGLVGMWSFVLCGFYTGVGRGGDGNRINVLRSGHVYIVV